MLSSSFAAPAADDLHFSVRRREPVLVKPAKPTPNELKYLSDIDDQEGLRFHIPGFIIYHHDPRMRGRDPAGVIREALANALVYYYPLAGRLREGPNRKLMVECTGEGVLFVEADADVKFEELGERLRPPFPCFEELLYDVPGPGCSVLNCPVIFVQVTRFSCGGFIFAFSFNHAMTDATGFTLFLSAIAELARGAEAPSIPPVWGRELLQARDPPRPSRLHREYENVPGPLVPFEDMACRSFFFGPAHIAALKSHIPPHLKTVTTFEILTAFLWKCRTVALGLDPEEEVRLICLINARAKFYPPFPAGYYGNVVALPAAVLPAGKLTQNPVGYAVERVRKAKEDVTEEYMRSVADFMVLTGRPHFTLVGTFIVSDMTRVTKRNLDLGWGKEVYVGHAEGAAGANPWNSSFYMAYRNEKREEGILVPISLPAPAMKRFAAELEKMMRGIISAL